MNNVIRLVNRRKLVSYSTQSKVYLIVNVFIHSGLWTSSDWCLFSFSLSSIEGAERHDYTSLQLDPNMVPMETRHVPTPHCLILVQERRPNIKTISCFYRWSGRMDTCVKPGRQVRCFWRGPRSWWVTWTKLRLPRRRLTKGGSEQVRGPAMHHKISQMSTLIKVGSCVLLIKQLLSFRTV